MKELIRFSINRRFKNKATILFNICIFLFIGILSFSDILLNTFFPSILKKDVIYTYQLEDDLCAYLNNNASDTYEFKVLDTKENEVVSKGNIVLKKENNTYVLHSKYTLSELEIVTFEKVIQNYERSKLIQNQSDALLISAYETPIDIKNDVYIDTIDMSEEKTNLLFIFVSGVYFMMLSFVSSVVSEVINEKATKTLELILTSVSAKTHFYAKLIVGWLVIVLQGIFSLSYILFFLTLRYFYDDGTGLIKMIHHLNIFPFDANSMSEYIHNFGINAVFINKAFTILLFLMLGILFLQLIMVILSSFVSTIEEAGNVQAPFYLLLLVFYYIALAINNPEQLSEGIGFYLSFIPFLNMLIMPCRLMIQDVPFIQLCVSLGFTLISIYVIFIKLEPFYEEGVLDYSNKGFVQILKRMHQLNKNKTS